MRNPPPPRQFHSPRTMEGIWHVRSPNTRTRYAYVSHTAVQSSLFVVLPVTTGSTQTVGHVTLSRDDTKCLVCSPRTTTFTTSWWRRNFRRMRQSWVASQSPRRSVSSSPKRRLSVAQQSAECVRISHIRKSIRYDSWKHQHSECRWFRTRCNLWIRVLWLAISTNLKITHSAYGKGFSPNSVSLCQYHSTNTPYPSIAEAIQSYGQPSYRTPSTRWHSWLRQCAYKPAGFRFDSRYCH